MGIDSSVNYGFAHFVWLEYWVLMVLGTFLFNLQSCVFHFPYSTCFKLSQIISTSPSDWFTLSLPRFCSFLVTKIWVISKQIWVALLFLNLSKIALWLFSSHVIFQLGLFLGIRYWELCFLSPQGRISFPFSKIPELSFTHSWCQALLFFFLFWGGFDSYTINKQKIWWLYFFWHIYMHPLSQTDNGVSCYTNTWYALSLCQSSTLHK